MEVNPYTGQPIDEDMPTNAAGRGAVAGIGVGPDGEPGYDPKRKKRKRTLIDARSKSYRQHRERLEKARAKREERKSKLASKVAENIDNFAREKYIEENNSDKIKKLEKMLQDLERKKKKTPGGGFAKMKIKQLIADLKGLRETTHTKDYETFVQLAAHARAAPRIEPVRTLMVVVNGGILGGEPLGWLIEAVWYCNLCWKVTKVDV